MTRLDMSFEWQNPGGKDPGFLIVSHPGAVYHLIVPDAWRNKLRNSSDGLAEAFVLSAGRLLVHAARADHPQTVAAILKLATWPGARLKQSVDRNFGRAVIVAKKPSAGFQELMRAAQRDGVYHDKTAQAIGYAWQAASEEVREIVQRSAQMQTAWRDAILTSRRGVVPAAWRPFPVFTPGAAQSLQHT